MWRHVTEPPMIRRLRPAPFPNPGFTLTELLAVIVILGVLAGILIPLIGRARESATASACSANLRTLHQATALYAGDHSWKYPPTYGSMGVTNTAWWQELFPAYCSDPATFKCPADETGFSGTYKATWTRNGLTLPNGKVSYGAAGHVGTASNGAALDYKVMGKKTAIFPKPAASILYTEQQSADCRLGEYWRGNYPRWPSEMTFPHASKAGFVFLDGHVETMSRQEIDTAIAAGRVLFGPADPAFQ